MSDESRETCWSRLTEEQRAEVIAICFRCPVETVRDPFTPFTRAAAQHAWEREAGR